MFHISKLSTIVIALALTACVPPPPPPSEFNINETSTQSSSITPETIHLNNCGGSAETQQVAERSQVITIEGSAELGFPSEILRAAVLAKYTQTSSIRKAQTLIAAAGTNMEFELAWSEQSWTGNVNASGKAGQATYHVTVPLSVELVSSRNLGCDGSTGVAVSEVDSTPAPGQPPTSTGAATPTEIANTPTEFPNTPTELPNTPTTIPPAPVPSCPTVNGPFAGVWSQVQAKIGCAANAAQSGQIVDEHFQGGMMVWRQPVDTAQAVVLFNSGSWQIFQHTPFVEGSPDFPCADANTPAQSPPTPKRGFGMMWCDISQIRSGLGNALDAERSYTGSMQQFSQGFMVQTDAGANFIFYSTGVWESR